MGSRSETSFTRGMADPPPAKTSRLQMEVRLLGPPLHPRPTELPRRAHSPGAPIGLEPHRCAAGRLRARCGRARTVFGAGKLRKRTSPTPLYGGAPRLPQPSGCAARAEEHGHKCTTVHFQVPSAEERREAIGGYCGAPFLLQRVLRFAEVWFEPIAEPRSKDWLGRHRELMQTFAAFRASVEEQRGRMGPTAERRCIHILPIGREPAPWLVEHVRAVCAAFFFPLRVAIVRRAGEPMRGANAVLDGDELIRWLSTGLRADSALTVAITRSSIELEGRRIPGVSSWEHRVGAFELSSLDEACVPSTRLSSQSRQVQSDDSAFLSPLVEKDNAPTTDALLLEIERAAKLVTHQALHMFGMLHCCFFRCLMNGAESQEETDGRPPFLCGMCLKKLHLLTGCDPLERYTRLASAWKSTGCADTALWYETRVRIVRSTLAGARASTAPTRRPPSIGRESATSTATAFDTTTPTPQPAEDSARASPSHSPARPSTAIGDYVLDREHLTPTDGAEWQRSRTMPPEGSQGKEKKEDVKAAKGKATHSEQVGRPPKEMKARRPGGLSLFVAEDGYSPASKAPVMTARSSARRASESPAPKTPKSPEEAAMREKWAFIAEEYERSRQGLRSVRVQNHQTATGNRVDDIVVGTRMT